MLTRYKCSICGDAETVKGERSDSIRLHCDTEMEEFEAVYTCKPIGPGNPMFTEILLSMSGDQREKIYNEELQIFVVHRFDNNAEAMMIYAPKQHMLTLAVIGDIDSWMRAKDIPSMKVGLDWWINYPDIWNEHVVPEDRIEWE